MNIQICYNPQTNNYIVLDNELILDSYLDLDDAVRHYPLASMGPVYYF